MSVQTEIDRITQNIQSAYAVLAALGAEMPADLTSDNLAATAGTAKALLYIAQMLTEDQQAQARENIGINEEWKAALKAEIIKDMGGVVTYVDPATMRVILSNVPEGDYDLYVRLADGTLVPYGPMEEDSDTYYSVTNTLTNCTSSNSATQAVGGEAYEATITANDGYTLESVVVIMGGVDVTADVVSGGTISIGAVAGDIVITAVAVEAAEDEPSYTNLADPSSSDWGTNKRLGSDGTFRDESGTTVTNYVPIYAGQTIRIEALNITAKSCAVYDNNKVVRSVGLLTTQTLYLSDISVSETGGQATWSYANGGTADAPWYIRFGGILTGSASDVVITINEPIK